MEAGRTRETAGTQTQQWEGRQLGGGRPLLTTENDRSKSDCFSMELEKCARTTTLQASYCDMIDRGIMRVRESALLIEIHSPKLSLFFLEEIHKRRVKRHEEIANT